MNRWKGYLSGGILILLSFLMLFLSFHSWKEQQNFLHGEKIKTTAIVKVAKNKSKTYHYDGVNYGVAAYDTKAKADETVTVYYLKDNPSIVSESQTIYHTNTSIFSPLMWFSIFLVIPLFKGYIFILNRRANR